jgi:uncharacterized protein (TIGR02246 family)
MRPSSLGSRIVLSLLAWGFPYVGAAQSVDEAAIRQVQTQQAEAWNRHDARAYADLFAEDGDVVNVVGWWWQGRSEIERKLTEAFAVMFRESKLSVTDVRVRFLTPEIALAHVRWTMTGAKAPPGVAEPRQGIQTQVLQKRAGTWLIAGFQNTNRVPERPFPRAAGPDKSAGTRR